MLSNKLELRHGSKPKWHQQHRDWAKKQKATHGVLSKPILQRIFPIGGWQESVSGDPCSWRVLPCFPSCSGSNQYCAGTWCFLACTLGSCIQNFMSFLKLNTSFVWCCLDKSKALDKITRWSRGSFHIANTSQRIDRMGVINDCKHPFPCITPWAQTGIRMSSKTELRDDGSYFLIWSSSTWILRPHGAYFISHRQRFLTGFSAAQVRWAEVTQLRSSSNQPANVRLGSPHDDGASHRQSLFQFSEQSGD